MPERDALDWDSNRSSNSLIRKRLQTIVSNPLPLKSRRMRKPMIASIITAGTEAIAHFIIKATIDPKGICTSGTMTWLGVSLAHVGIDVAMGVERRLANNRGYV